jgi:hypothetical protein
MAKYYIIAIAFFAGFFATLGSSKVREWMDVGEHVHQEIVLLRADTRGLRNSLIVTNGLLAAILAALVF